MAEGSRPNFFILLGLDPRERWDPGKFEARLEEKSREWARESSGVGKKAIEAKRNLGLIGQIRQVMGDDAPRQAEAKNALSETDTTRRSRLQEFDETLRIAQVKGSVKENEIKGWVQTFKDVLTEAEIRKRITVPIEAQATAADASKAPQLDPTIAKNIRERLETLGLADLYALLELPRTTATPALRVRATALNNELQRNMNKTAELTMKMELTGYAMDIFRSDEMRDRYDTSLRNASIEALLHKYEVVFRGAGEVNEKQAALFLQEARAAGWETAVASEQLKALAAKRKWAIYLGGIETIAQSQVCGNCGELNDANAQYCVRCSRELKIECPKCGRKVESNARACPQCGFPVGNHYLVDSCLEESKRLLDARDYDGAERLLTSAEGSWADAKPTDARKQRIQQRRKEVDAARQQRQQTVERLRRLMDSERKFFEAQTILDSLPANTLPNQAALRQQSGDAIAQARRLVTQARTMTGAPDEVANICQQALRICADYAEARELLAKNPPAPPSQLVVQRGAEMINLRWSPSPTRGATGYRVVRKSGSQPVSANDGRTLATVAGAYYDDTSPEVGIALFYAIFTDREGVPSAQAAATSQPIMLTPDVKNVATRVDNGLVELSWQAPTNVRRITVTRKMHGAPRDAQDGDQLTPLDLTHLTDRGVRNDMPYFYRITCYFADNTGTLKPSQGVVIEATPQIPPAPINDLRIEVAKAPTGEHIATLRWTAPNKGRAVILKSQRQLQASLGTVLPEETLRNHGQVLEGQRGTVVDTWPQSGACYYTPVTLFQHMAYVGTSQRFAAVDDVSSLKIQNLGATLRISWTWPAGCQAARVMTSGRQWPGADDPEASAHAVTKSLYDRLSFVELPGQHSQDLFVVVYAEMLVDGVVTLATGTSPGARSRLRVASKVSLEYDIKRVKPLFGTLQILLRLHPRTPTALPAFIIRSKQYGLPFHKNDGEFLERIGPFPEPFDKLEVPLPIKAYPPETFGKLFLEDDGQYELVEVNHPAREKLRLDQ